MSDPLIYKLLALLQIVLWSSFVLRYVIVLVRNGILHRPRRSDWRSVVSANGLLARFAGAVLMIGIAMVSYSLATVLRQFLGLDYWGRDGVRIVSSVLILAAGCVLHLVLTKEHGRPK